MAAADLTAARLREVLDYDPETGLFHWKIKRGNAAAGDLAGGRNGVGYWLICVDKSNRAGHRLAWLFMTGEWPAHEVDHRDGDRTNNRWSNLRQSSGSLNQENLHVSWSRLGVPGVRLQRGRYRATIRVKGRDIGLGTFDTVEQAHAAYIAAKRELHDGCTI